MANVMTDQFLGAMLGQRSAPRGPRDEDELLSVLGGPAPAPVAYAPETATPQPSPSSVEAPPPSAPAPAPPDVQSRVDRLLSTLQRPERRDHVLASVFDSLVGGDRFSSDVRARRNQFDQALMGAQAADAGSEERAAESEAGRGMQRDQMALTQRGQDLADKRAEEQRRLQEQLLGLRLGSTSAEKEKDRIAALERAKLGRHHGTGAPQTPEAKAEAENLRMNMEAAHLVRVANAPGKPAPYTQKQVMAYLKGEQTDLSPEALAQLELERSTLAGMRSQDPKKYADIIASASKGEAASAEGIGRTTEAAREKPKDRLQLKTELSDMKADVANAIRGWNSMSPTARETFVQFAGGGGNLAQTIKDIKLSPEDKAHAASIQSLANVLIKARSGSAVTGSEWQRVASEIGLPVGDWSIFNSPSVLSSWLQKAKQGHDRRRANVLSEYPDLFKESSGAKP